MKAGDRVQITSYGLFRNCSGSIRRVIPLPGPVAYVVELDVGHTISVNERHLTPLSRQGVRRAVDPLFDAEEDRQ